MEVVVSKANTIDAHNLSKEELYQHYNSSGEGLSEQQAKENLAKYGPPTNAKNMPECTMVKRDGQLQQILSEELTLGDLLYLNPSRSPYIQADVVITNTHETLWVESSFLYQNQADANFLKKLAETKTDDSALKTDNLAFAGTKIFSGSGFGLVFATGDNTLLHGVDPKLLRPDEEEENVVEESTGNKVKGFFKKILNYFKGDAEEVKEDLTFSYHTEEMEDICNKFHTDVVKGLTTEQVEKNQVESGRNVYREHNRIHHGYTQCIRDGQIQKILTKNLTPGDLIKMKAPQIVPADVLIVEVAPNTKVDKSSLTGESEPKTLELKNDEENPLEATNVAWSTTKLVEGSCSAIVVQVGRRTLTGKLPAPTTLEF